MLWADSCFQPVSFCVLGWLVGCKHEFTKTTEQISTGLGRMKGLDPEKTQSTFSADPNKESAPDIVK